jgi:putative ABC transport system substrate-binding protein
MDRRRFLLTSVAGALGAPLAAEAERAGRVWRIGFVEAGSAAVNRHFLNAFRHGMGELGYAEGRDLAIEDRWAEGRNDLFPSLLAELIGRKVDVLVVASGAGALAAKRATTTVPVVFNAGVDPVAHGLVVSLARPGGNMTGLSLAWNREFYAKWVELLKEVVPTATRIAALRESGALAIWTNHVRDAAKVKGVEVEFFEVKDAEELDRAFAVIASKKIRALVVLPGPFTVRYRARVLDLAAKTRVPAVYGFGEFPQAGGLMSYGAHMPEVFRRMAYFVDKILKGAKPADLPVEQPTKFELIINLKTAKALGLMIAPSLLLRADQVIE